ncbi:MAG: manganese efflux pump [Erysipelotrichaceae bacterium]|nr:manganese efflux pump [Erysipelotrichaceae bacterium]
MEWLSIVTVLLLGVALSMDAFAVSIVDGLSCSHLDNKKKVFAPAMFGIFQGIMPLIGYFISYFFVAQFAVLQEIVPCVAFSLLLFIGGKMIIEAVIDLRKRPEDVCPKKLTYKGIIIQAIATSIDALAVGVSLLDLTKNAYSPFIFLDVAIIAIITFVICIIGIKIGKRVKGLFQDKVKIAEIVGGIILLIIGIEIVVTHYFPLPF